jgi:hypothetical protein
VTAPHNLARLTRHSAIYGLGDLVARLLGVLLLPLYTAYLSPADYGKIEILVAASAVLLVVLRRGVSEGFFRFYFDSPETAHRRTVVRTTFWFTMTTATVALVLATAFAEPLSHVRSMSSERAGVIGSPPARNSVPAMSARCRFAATQTRAAAPTDALSSAGVPARTLASSHRATSLAAVYGT